MNIVYVQVDLGKVKAIDSNAFLDDATGWVQIDEGDGDRYMHAQGNYLPKSLMDMQGRYRYKLVDGVVVERPQEELAADVLPVEPAPVTVEERLAALEGAVLEMAFGGEA